MIINEELKEKLRNLADKYETADFYNGDPSCVLKRYQRIEDVECAAFIAAVLAFGQRKFLRYSKKNKLYGYGI